MHTQNKNEVPYYIRAFTNIHLKFLSSFSRIILNSKKNKTKQNKTKNSVNRSTSLVKLSEDLDFNVAF